MTSTSVVVILTVCVAMVTVSMATESCDDGYCHPGESCWPGYQEMYNLIKSLDGHVILPTDEHYRNLSIMINTRVTRYPYAIILVDNVHDVIKSVNFANRYNIKLSIRSSGHDYIGRSTGDGTLQINLFNMKGLAFNLNSTRHVDGEVSAESGNTWIKVYTEANKYGRVVVGGSAHTVSMGGYTLGGGHSPMGRKFGLAVDNLLEVEMVTAKGELLYADGTSTRYVHPETGEVISTSANTDIFWAIRGGGGGTFGIVTAFTYKLHLDSKMVMLSCNTKLVHANGTDVGVQLMKSFNDVLATTLAPEWGGYEILYQAPQLSDSGILLFLNHYGEYGSDSYLTINPFLSKYNSFCKITNVTNFLEYELNAKDPLYYPTYVFNTFMQPNGFSDGFYDFVVDMVTKPRPMDITVGCTGTLVGGNMKNVADDAAPINPYFRSGSVALTCGVVPGESIAYDVDQWVAEGKRLSKMLASFGRGTYYNEAAEDLPDWKIKYWGSEVTYNKLLAVKQHLDPDNKLWCLHCVGSDLTPVKDRDDDDDTNRGAPVYSSLSLLSLALLVLLRLSING